MFDQDYLVLPYSGGAPGADSNTYVLYDSTLVAGDTPAKNPMQQYRRYSLSIKNPAVCTLKAYAKTDGGSWVQFYQLALAAATGTANNEIGIPLQPHVNVRIDLVNGGLSQASGWYLSQGLDSGQAASRPTYFDANSDVDPGDVTTVITPQLPTSLGAKAKDASLSITIASDQLGQTTKAASVPVVLPSDQLGQQASAASLSTVFASDSVERAAAALRGPLRNEILVFGLTGASVAYNVPDGSIGAQPNWKGKYIEAYADGCDVYLQFDTGTAAAVDETLLSTTSTVGGRTSVAPAGNEAWLIPRGQWIPIPVPSNAQTFALKGSVSTGCKLRTKLAQS